MDLLPESIVSTPTTNPQAQFMKRTKLIRWMLLALIAHTGWGIYPVLVRYLQNVQHIPSMQLLLTGNTTVSVVTLAIVLKRKKFKSLFKIKYLSALMLITLVRVVTNLVSPKYTGAVNVQLMTIMAPLMVAILNFFITKEPLPPYTIPSVVFCTLGSILMLLSNVFPFQISFTVLDWAGIGLAFVSAFFLALYMVMVKKTMVDHPTVRGEELLFYLTFPVVIFAGFATIFTGEDWSVWKDMTKVGWVVWVLVAFGILLFGNLLQITSIQALGAPLVSTLLAFRLVSALIFSAVVMHEELTDVFQFIGAAMVLITVTCYMVIQKRASKK